MLGNFGVRFFTRGYEQTMREISTIKKAKASRKMHKKKRSKKKKQ